MSAATQPATAGNVVPGPGATPVARPESEPGVPAVAFAQAEYFRAQEALFAANARPWGEVGQLAVRGVLVGVGLRMIVGWWRR